MAFRTSSVAEILASKATGDCRFDSQGKQRGLGFRV